MTQVVTVQTDFADLSQMTEGLMQRVHDTHIILTGPDDITEGDWVQFAVNLVDGTPGFAGVGRCVRAVDNGDARQPHQRFDLVIDSLQFDQHGQDVYQHILMSRNMGEAQPDAPAEGQEPVDEATRVEVPGDQVDPGAAYADSADAADGSGNLEADGDADSFGQVDDGMGDLDASDMASEEYQLEGAPAVSSAPPPPPSGPQLFVFSEGLPMPPVPPRPELDPSLRVTPAPRPSEDAGQDTEAMADNASGIAESEADVPADDFAAADATSEDSHDSDDFGATEDAPEETEEALAASADDGAEPSEETAGAGETAGAEASGDADMDMDGDLPAAEADGSMDVEAATAEAPAADDAADDIDFGAEGVDEAEPAVVAEDESTTY